MALARIGNSAVVKVVSQVIEDLVRGMSKTLHIFVVSTVSTHFLFFFVFFPGEFMQLGSKENENERFKHYLEKTYKKTASLMAHSCKAVCTFNKLINKSSLFV